MKGYSIGQTEEGDFFILDVNLDTMKIIELHYITELTLKAFIATCDALTAQAITCDLEISKSPITGSRIFTR